MKYCVAQRIAKETLVQSTCFVQCSGNYHQKHQYNKKKGKFIEYMIEMQSLMFIVTSKTLNAVSTQYFNTQIDNLCYESFDRSEHEITKQTFFEICWHDSDSQSQQKCQFSQLSKAIEVEFLSMNYVLLFILVGVDQFDALD